jgi:hypothetical protein
MRAALASVRRKCAARDRRFVAQVVTTFADHQVVAVNAT